MSRLKLLHDVDSLFSFAKLRLIKGIKLKVTIYPENLKLRQEKMSEIQADLVDAIDGVLKKHQEKP